MSALRGMSLAVLAAAAAINPAPSSPSEQLDDIRRELNRPRFVKRAADPVKKAKRKAQKRARVITRKGRRA